LYFDRSQDIPGTISNLSVSLLIHNSEKEKQMGGEGEGESSYTSEAVPTVIMLVFCVVFGVGSKNVSVLF